MRRRSSPGRFDSLARRLVPVLLQPGYSALGSRQPQLSDQPCEAVVRISFQLELLSDKLLAADGKLGIYQTQRIVGGHSLGEVETEKELKPDLAVTPGRLLEPPPELGPANVGQMVDVARRPADLLLDVGDDVSEGLQPFKVGIEQTGMDSAEFPEVAIGSEPLGQLVAVRGRLVEQAKDRVLSRLQRLSASHNEPSI